jgi:1-deoxy-D-xylulose-5-phosphate reductoisomerase
LNAANEIAVEAFLCEKVGFLDIPRIIAMVIEGYSCTAVGGLDEILAADAWARQTAESVIVEIQGAAYA